MFYYFYFILYYRFTTTELGYLHMLADLSISVAAPV